MKISDSVATATGQPWDERFLKERLDQSFKGRPIVLLANLINPIIIVLVLWGSVSSAALSAWVGIIYALSALRFGASRRYAKADLSTMSAALSWKKAYIAEAFLSGAAWGMIGMLAHNETLINHVFIVLFLAGMTAGAVVAHAFFIEAYIAYVSPALLPLIAYFLFSGDKMYLGMGALVTIYLALMIIIAARLNHFILDSIITKHKNLELTDKITTITSSVNDAIIMTTGDGVVTFWNQAAGKMFGYNSSEALGAELKDLIIPEKHRESHVRNLRHFAKTGTGATLDKTVEITATRKDGSEFPVELSISATLVKGEWNAVGAVRDITERKRAEEEKKKATNRLQQIASRVPGVVYQFLLRPDGSYCVPYASEAIRDIWRLSPEDVREDVSKAFAVVHPDDFGAFLNSIQESARDLTPWKHEFRLKFGDEPERWLFGDAVPQREADGSTLWHGFITEITSRKQAEDELRLAKEQAEAATKLKDQFVSLVAHDLRSPFISMMGLLKHLAENKSLLANDEDQKVLDTVFKNGDLMLMMIENLLKISRLQTGEIMPQPRFFKGYVAVEVTIGFISHDAAQKGIEIINEVPVDTRLYADQSLFDEVLLNLLSNAIKFCSKGDKITFFMPPGLRSAIAIRDTGKGISEKNISNIFKPEVTTSTPGTAGELGTGFGLPFCHDIMKAHGGEITVESAPGKGSVFCAILPYVRPIALVVDDDHMSLLIVRSHLEKIDVVVMEAVSGEQALSAIKDKRPHIIITDIIMPEMDGYTLLDRLKQDSATSGIPVIVMTSANGEAREKAFRHGADDFVGKPIVVEDFIPRVRRFVG